MDGPPAQFSSGILYTGSVPSPSFYIHRHQLIPPPDLLQPNKQQSHLPSRRHVSKRCPKRHHLQPRPLRPNNPNPNLRSPNLPRPPQIKYPLHPHQKDNRRFLLRIPSHDMGRHNPSLHLQKKPLRKQRQRPRQKRNPMSKRRHKRLGPNRFLRLNSNLRNLRFNNLARIRLLKSTKEHAFPCRSLCTLHDRNLFRNR